MKLKKSFRRPQGRGFSILAIPKPRYQRQLNADALCCRQMEDSMLVKYTRQDDVVIRSVPGMTLKAEKAASGEGIVEAIVSVFGVVDWYNDVIQPGAFAKTITERLGDMVVLDNHRTSSTLDVIGSIMEAREVGREDLPSEVQSQYPEATGGLYVKLSLDLDTPEGLGIFKRLKKGTIRKYSIGFNIVKSSAKKFKVVRDGIEREVLGRLITEIKLWEVSPVIFAANEATATVAVKNLDGSPFEGDPDEIKASLTQQIQDVVMAFDMAGGDHDYFIVREVFTDHVVVRSIFVEAYRYYSIAYSSDPDSGGVTFASRENWKGGNYVFVEGERNLDLNEMGQILKQLSDWINEFRESPKASDEAEREDTELSEAEPPKALTSAEEIRARIRERIAQLDT